MIRETAKPSNWIDIIDSLKQLILVDVKGKKTIIQNEGHIIELKIEGQEMPSHIDEVIGSLKGTMPYIIESDVFEMDHHEVNLKYYDDTLYHSVLKNCVSVVIPFFHTIITQEATPIIITSTMDEKRSRLEVHAGMVGDTQVLLLSITPK